MWATCTLSNVYFTIKFLLKNSSQSKMILNIKRVVVGILSICKVSKIPYNSMLYFIRLLCETFFYILTFVAKVQHNT